MNQKHFRAEIIMVDLGSIPDQVRGHEQANLRPCLVIKPIDSLKLAIIIPFTSQTKLTVYSVVEVKKGQGGLISNSYALCHQIRSVSYDRLGKPIGVLPETEFFKILTVLADFLEIPQ